METVAAVECQSYNEEEVYLAIKKAIERSGFILPENITVLIKPNIIPRTDPISTPSRITPLSVLCVRY